MNRTTIINHLAKLKNVKKYLEIGVSDGENFKAIDVAYKVGVDPETSTPATIHVTSDEFFRTNKEKFDLIFVDGLHEDKQVYNDILNAFDALSDGGFVVAHDMNPIKEEHQIVPYAGGTWNGDCWKALVTIQQKHRDINYVTVDTDHGCAILWKREVSESFDVAVSYPEKTYDNLEKNRKNWLNLISPTEFYSMFYLPEANLENLIQNYVLDPNNPVNNFSLARYYDLIGQTASALSFYIRTAERTTDDLLKYQCLLLCSSVFERQGTRGFSVKGMLQHAIAVQPERPEAYYFLSRYFENEKDEGRWFNSYMITSIGLAKTEPEMLFEGVNYPGRYALLFQKAHAAWWCGLCEESKSIFLDLYHNHPEMDSFFRNLVVSNLKVMGIDVQTYDLGNLTIYNKSKHSSLRHKFKGSETIENNFSESYQDMFVLSMLDGKRNGCYLEIGHGHPHYGNNTFLLEKQFDWAGLSIDLDEGFVNAFASTRKNSNLLKDATKTNYENLLRMYFADTTIDYLQIDVDPAEVSLKTLLSIPFETYKFRVITFEHDVYQDASNLMIREKSREFLKSHGYVMVAGNISPDKNRPYEDWWVNQSLIENSETFFKMMRTDDSTVMAEDYMMGRVI